MAPKPETLERNFWKRVVKTETCWLWQGTTNYGGYGIVHRGPRVQTRRFRAHRIAYEMLVGPIPEGLVIDHLCRVRHCVNPAHMEPVTRGENVMRGIGLPVQHAAKARCPQGHAYDDANTYLIKTGGRSCRTCGRNRARAKWRRQAAARREAAQAT